MNQIAFKSVSNNFRGYKRCWIGCFTMRISPK
ncbi:hypothetical protein ACZ87_02106, partial [Candidatus Erwinia dacicola]